MALVKIVDIDGVQWEIKDETARNKIANLEGNNTTKDLQDITINLKEGYEAVSASITQHYSYGKIHFALINLINIKGNNIGSSTTTHIAALNVHPKKSTTFLMNDYKNKATLRCSISPDGTLTIEESVGVISGDNICYGEIIFAEP